MKNKVCILSLLSLSTIFSLTAQNSTFSPYSRYGLGELVAPVAPHNSGMANTNLALKADSTIPVLINTGNPASYALIRLTSLEVGGRYGYSQFRTGSSKLNKWGTNFTYAALGIPIGSRGGLCFAMMPYSYVGFDGESKQNVAGIGDVINRHSGTGGLNRVNLGYGVMPFQQRWLRFRRKQVYADSLNRLSHAAFMRRDFANRFLSDLSIGTNVNYIFGSLQNTSRIIYPNSALYNHSYFENMTTMGDFTGNFGVQGAVSVDSVKTKGQRRGLKRPVKFTFGFFMNLQNPLQLQYNDVSYNYILTGAGEEIIRDTVLYQVNQSSQMTLPLEQGFGIGFKKGEKLNLVADFAITGWSKFKYPGNPAVLKDNYRVSVGMNLVPEKAAAGRRAYLRSMNYRFGISHETGYILLNNRLLSNSFVSAGFGFPVGKVERIYTSMVQVSLQLGTMGVNTGGLLQENYFRVHFGFTFGDRWFRKFKYD